MEALFQINEDEKEEEFVGFTREEVDKVVEMQSIVWLIKHSSSGSLLR